MKLKNYLQSSQTSKFLFISLFILLLCHATSAACQVESEGSEEVEDIIAKLNQISEQKDLHEVAKELIFPSMILALLFSVLKHEPQLAMIVTFLIIAIISPIINLIKTVITVLSNKDANILKQLKLILMDSDLSEDEIGLINEKLSKTQTKILNTKKPIIARIIRMAPLLILLAVITYFIINWFRLRPGYKADELSLTGVNTNVANAVMAAVADRTGAHDAARDALLNNSNTIQNRIFYYEDLTLSIKAMLGVAIYNLIPLLTLEVAEYWRKSKNKKLITEIKEALVAINHSK